jgi:hypothetical protein
MSSPGDDLWESEEQFAQLHLFLVAQGHRDVLLFPHSDREEIFHNCSKQKCRLQPMQGKKSRKHQNGFILQRKSGENLAFTHKKEKTGI